MTEAEMIKAAKAIREMSENLPMHLEYAAFQAKLTRAKYNALVADGFTAEQALALCRPMP